MKQFLIAGNWKMNTDIHATADLLESIWNLKNSYKDSVQVLVCPPFTNLAKANEILKDKPIHLGSQNCYWEVKGAFTGEISLEMIKSCGCKYVIIGHSERRSLFGETNQMINNKLHAIL
jgi:triosephosphate isomerase